MSISIRDISVSIGGNVSTKFDIEIEGIKYRLDHFSLRQSLMAPNSLSFSARKADPEEDISETEFALCGQLIGKEITLSLMTDNVENMSLNGDSGKTSDIEFQGVIVSASGSRDGTEYDVQVEAYSWDALISDSPNCKSYEQMTLNDIVNDVLDDYSDHIQAEVNARFTDPIPYCVQYNETNAQFLRRLAMRYGEWLYNDGTHMVFGQLVDQDAIRLAYPSQDVPSYGIDLKMQHVAFNHLASSYNAYDANQKDALGEMQRSYNKLSDEAFQASQDLYTKPTLQNLHSGGFADNDGRETVLNISTKTQGRGVKAGLLSYSGRTYCSRLKIGGRLVIEDNFITNSSSNTKSPVDQDEILIIGLTHFFSADETYSNHFTGIPSECDYPPYTDSDVYPFATSCRAKVKDNEDPNNLGRVRVQFDWQAQQDDGMMTPWLRMSQPYAGGGKGFSFIPEIDEEVMVDFEGGNAERPYVKGTLYNGVADPDSAWLPGSNQVKAIRTRNGHTIEIWDKGEGGYIRIYDNEKENYILTFSTDEQLIKLESTGNIELYAKNDIIIEAGHDIKTSAGNDSIHRADNDVKVNAGNDMQLAAAHDQTRSADNDIREHAGNDRSASIDRNDSLHVSENQHTEVGDSQNVKVQNKLQVQATDIRIEAQSKIEAQAAQINEKASTSMALNANASIDIKGGMVKVN